MICLLEIQWTKVKLNFKVDALDTDIKSLKKAARQTVMPEILKEWIK